MTHHIRIRHSHRRWILTVTHSNRIIETRRLDDDEDAAGKLLHELRDKYPMAKVHGSASLPKWVPSVDEIYAEAERLRSQRPRRTAEEVVAAVEMPVWVTSCRRRSFADQ